ncbi:MAG: sulfotransferase [Gemmatimonadota bacterium]|nr:sulfotransferase [Gemmatimonadota bacterium]
MPYSLGIWARGFAHGLTRPGRLRRTGFTLTVFGLWSVIRIVVALGRAVDHVLFPAFRRRAIERPVFVVGSPRSGTTFLHGLLALDEARFSSLRLYETLLPSIALCRLVEIGGAVDRRLGRPLGRAAVAIQRRVFGGWQGIHETALARHEEPEGLWALRMMTPAVYLLFPFFDELPELSSLEAVRGDRARRAAIRFYVGSLRRHLYLADRRTPGRTLLVKTVLFPSRLRAVCSALPDIRFVQLVRDPRRTIPSALSMLTAPWKAHSPRMVGATPETRMFANVLLDGIAAYAAARDRTPAERWLTLSFEDLVADPGATVERVYDFLGLVSDSALNERRERAAEEARRTTRAHSYSLADFGLSAADIEDAASRAMFESVHRGAS